VIAEGLAERITARGLVLGVPLGGEVVAGLVEYLRLLSRWNQRINLTALPLDPIADAALDKLVLEPLVGASLLPVPSRAWVDLGSGGGSPALPLRLAARSGSLTLVESRSRKCAFLREAVRTMGLAGTVVASERFESFSGGPFDVATFRAVRVDREFADFLVRILEPGGTVLSFGSTVLDSRFDATGERVLPDGSVLYAAMLRA